MSAERGAHRAGQLPTGRRGRGGFAFRPGRGQHRARTATTTTSPCACRHTGTALRLREAAWRSSCARTYVDQVGGIPVLQVVQDGCLVEVGEVGHVLRLVELWRVDFVHEVQRQRVRPAPDRASAAAAARSAPGAGGAGGDTVASLVKPRRRGRAASPAHGGSPQFFGSAPAS